MARTSVAIAPACSATVATLRMAASMSSSLSAPARRWMPARVGSASLPRRTALEGARRGQHVAAGAGLVGGLGNRQRLDGALASRGEVTLRVEGQRVHV